MKGKTIKKNKDRQKVMECDPQQFGEPISAHRLRQKRDGRGVVNKKIGSKEREAVGSGQLISFPECLLYQTVHVCACVCV